MKKITLAQLLQYLESDRNIQIVLSNKAWDDAEEIRAGSELLQPYWDCEVEDIGGEESFQDKGEFVLRISVGTKKGKANEDSD